MDSVTERGSPFHPDTVLAAKFDITFIAPAPDERSNYSVIDDGEDATSDTPDTSATRSGRGGSCGSTDDQHDCCSRPNCFNRQPTFSKF
jgi:hypothetical protein